MGKFPGTLDPPLGLLGASSGLMEVCSMRVLSAYTEEVLDSRETPDAFRTCSRTVLTFQEDMRGASSLLQGQPKPGWNPPRRHTGYCAAGKA